MNKETKETTDDVFESLSFLTDTAVNSKPNGKEIEKKEEKKEEKEEKVEQTDEPTPEEIEAKKEIDENLKKKEKTKETEENKKGNEDDDGEEPEVEGVIPTLISSLKDEGIIRIPDDFKIEDDEDSLYKAIKETVKASREEEFNSYDEDTQKYLEFVRNGGNPRDFHRYYYNDGASFEDFDISTEENQKYIIAEGLRMTGIDDEEEIKDQLELFEDAGKLESKSKMYLSKLQKIEKDQKETLVAAQKEWAKKQETQRKQEWDSFKDGLFKTEEIAGFKFTKKMKEDLWEYMTKPDRKTGKTKYQIDAEEMGNQARYMTAYLQMKKWNKEDLESEVKSKATSDLKAKLNKYSDTITKKKSLNTERKKVESEDGDFSAWKNFL